MILLVGGQCRNVGKTTAVCQIIAATTEAGWIALKVTPHSHEPHRHGDTERYLEAGARRSYLISGPGAYRPLLPEDANVIIEGNSALAYYNPSLVIFVEDPSNPDWKASAHSVASAANYRSTIPLSEAILAAVREGITSRSSWK